MPSVMATALARCPAACVVIAVADRALSVIEELVPSTWVCETLDTVATSLCEADDAQVHGQSAMSADRVDHAVVVADPWCLQSNDVWAGVRTRWPPSLNAVPLVTPMLSRCCSAQVGLSSLLDIASLLQQHTPLWRRTMSATGRVHLSLFPCRARVVGVPFSCEPLWRLRQPVGTVEGVAMSAINSHHYRCAASDDDDSALLRIPSVDVALYGGGVELLAPPLCLLDVTLPEPVQCRADVTVALPAASTCHGCVCHVYSAQFHGVVWCATDVCVAAAAVGICGGAAAGAAARQAAGVGGVLLQRWLHRDVVAPRLHSRAVQARRDISCGTASLRDHTRLRRLCR
jgi:hypothetical protein